MTTLDNDDEDDDYGLTMPEEEDDDEEIGPEIGGYEAEVEVIEEVVLPGANGMNKLVPAKRHDWNAIQEWFVEGQTDGDGNITYPNYPETARHFNVNLTSVKQRGAKYRWRALQTAAQVQAQRQRQIKRGSELGKQAIRLDASSLQAAQMGVTLILSRLGEVAKEASARQDRRTAALDDLAKGLPIEREDLYTAIRAHDMMSLSAALRSFQEVGKNALGQNIQHVEFSGPDGEPIQIEHTVDVRDELTRDDPARLDRFFRAAYEAGVLKDPEFLAALEASDSILDAEVVEDTELDEGED